jgi:hypothetical protein
MEAIMAVDKECTNIHYLVGRVAAVVAADSDPEASITAIPNVWWQMVGATPLAALGSLAPRFSQLTPAAMSLVGDILMAIPAGATDPQGGCPIEEHNGVWIGFYHQRAALRGATVEIH